MITIIIRYGNHESNITLVCILDACVNLQIIFGNKRSRKLKGQLRKKPPTLKGSLMCSCAENNKKYLYGLLVHG
jgi:hypothetical protein